MRHYQDLNLCSFLGSNLRFNVFLLACYRFEAFICIAEDVETLLIYYSFFYERLLAIQFH